MIQKLLSGVIPKVLDDREMVLSSKKNLLSLMSKQVSFKEDYANVILKTVIAYFKMTGGFLDTDQFKDILVDNGVAPELVSKSVLKYDLAQTQEIPEGKFNFYLDRYVENRDKQDMEDTLIKALTVLKGTDDIDKGKTALSKTKDLLIPKLFDSAMISEEVPHGDITTERDELLIEYEEAEKTGGVVDGIYTGLDLIDKAFEAIVKGDLVVMAGASGEGKSWLASNVAWHASVVQKKNVVIVTAETLRQQYRRRIITRHSNLPKFGQPLELTKIKNGKLSEEEKEIYKMVIHDFTSGDYGMCEISQVANGTTMGDIQIYLEKLALSKEIHLLIIDYLTLLRPSSSNKTQREDAVALFKEAKNLAVTFNKGTGLPVIALHQISSDAREKAKFLPGKCYSLRSLADSSEAGKSADKALALFRDEDLEQDHELGMQILKTRDSCADDKMFKLFESYSTAFIGNLQEG